MQDVGRYWCHVVARAFHDAYTLLGHNPKKTVIGFVTVLIIALISDYIKDDTAAMAKIQGWTVSIGAAITIFALLFLYYLLRTPKVLQDEAVNNARGEADQLKSAIVKVQDEQRAQADKICVIEASHAAKVGELEKAVDYYRNSDPERNALRRQVAEFLETFQSLETEILNEDKKAASYVYQWEHTVATYLGKQLPAYIEFHNNPHVMLSGPQKLIMEETLTRCRGRIKQLKEVLEVIIR